jgi:uncharacterized repeat protein (TIGR01451 family)
VPYVYSQRGCNVKRLVLKMAVLALLWGGAGQAKAGPLSADLSVLKTGPSTVTAGTNITYTITVLNAGPSAADKVVLMDVVPTGTNFVSQFQLTGPTFTLSSTTFGGTTTTDDRISPWLPAPRPVLLW